VSMFEPRPKDGEKTPPAASKAPSGGFADMTEDVPF
jgi:hypothetical protein